MRAEMVNLGRAVVYGAPQPGGNKTPVAVRRKTADRSGYEFTGKINLLEGRNSKARAQVKSWRKLVIESVQKSELWEHHGTASPLVVKWYFTVKAPVRIPVERLGYPAVRPDTDKLVRATCDAVTDSGFWKDDALKISEMISKAYVNGFHPDGTPALHEPGCVIEIFEIIAGPA